MRLLLVSTLIAFNAIAVCPSSLDINFFSTPFTDVKTVQGYSGMLDEIDYLRYDLDGGDKYTIQISAGAMNEELPNRLSDGSTTRPLLLSDIMILDKDQNVKFRDIRKRRVSGTQIEAKRILKFVKKHIRKKLPFCTKS